MKLSDLTPVAQDGLRQWAEAMGDGLWLEDLPTVADSWSWVCFLLREAQDRPEWFPHGKWATIQRIESLLLEEAREIYQEES
jgi:hypothetical protein